ncbi:MAG TPA: cytochrome c biogenesis protein CcdA [Pyrinomonadaceae bacterium]|nr:cytochrome c biogenesis protein CcdA [Pyrinomonadaceae bacterium]
MFLFFSTVTAQNPVSLSMNVSPGSVPAGGKGTAKVTASIGGGWHMYSVTQGAGGPVPTRISIDGGPFKMNGVSGPRPKVQMDPNFGINTETYEGSATFTIPFTVAADTAEGAQTLNVNVRYQLCNDTMCLPPKTVKVSAPVTITAPKANSSPSPSPSASPSATPTPTVSPSVTPTPANTNANINTNINANVNSIANTNIATNTETNSNTNSVSSASVTNPNNPPPTNFDNGSVTQDTPLGSFLWAALVAGLISLLTPCVFPMIPITVSYFTKHAEGSRAKAVQNAFVFTLGIIFTFTVLGFLLAVLFGATGIQLFAANPYVNIFIGGLFIVFALSLFGAYELGVPSSVMTKLDSFARGKESSQYAGLLLMGLVFSLTSFTCTTPFVGSILVFSTQGSWLYPILGMLVFSSVFAFPFFLLAIAPQLLAQLPKSGGWLNSVKVVMGFLEIAAAMKFISNVDLVWGWGIFTREVVIASWVAVCLFVTIYLLGFFQLSHDTKPERLGAVRVVIALIFLSFGFYLLTGLFGKTLIGVEAFLPPKTESSSVSGNSNSANGEMTWITNNFEKAVEQAKKENKTIFIDFTGYTCTNCRWMEANMFPQPKVKEELAKYVLVRLYTDGEGQPYEGFQKMQEEKFKTVALPLYAIVTPDGNTLSTFPGLTRDENTFVKFLQSGKNTQLAKN